MLGSIFPSLFSPFDIDYGVPGKYWTQPLRRPPIKPEWFEWSWVEFQSKSASAYVS